MCVAVQSKQLAETQLALRCPACLSLPAHCQPLEGSEAADLVTDAAECACGSCIGRSVGVCL